MPFSRAATQCQVTWGAPFGRSVKRSFALLRLLARTGPLPARRVARLTASRLAVTINPWALDHFYTARFLLELRQIRGNLNSYE